MTNYSFGLDLAPECVPGRYVAGASIKGSARHELAHDLKQPLTNKNKRFPQLAVLAANVRGKKPANDSQRRTVYHFVYHGDREFR